MVEALVDWAIDYFSSMASLTSAFFIIYSVTLALPCHSFSLHSLSYAVENLDILVPMDNFISRGTAHFLTCKEPDYQQSLFNVLSTVSISSDSCSGMMCLCLLVVVNCKVMEFLHISI